MRALVSLLICWFVIACGSDFGTAETSDNPTARTPSSSTPEVVATGIGGATNSTVVVATTVAAGASSETNIAGAPSTAGAANGSGGASTTTTPAVALSGVARVLYWGASPAGTSSSIETAIELVNVSKTDWDLTEFRLRYWFTAELQGGAALVPQMGSGSLTTAQASIGTMLPARKGADHYVEIAFTKGTIIAGSSERLTFMTHQSNWGLFDQSDDYSYPTTLAKGGELDTVGVYHNGLLVAGVEP